MLFLSMSVFRSYFSAHLSQLTPTITLALFSLRSDILRALRYQMIEPSLKLRGESTKITWEKQRPILSLHNSFFQFRYFDDP